MQTIHKKSKTHAEKFAKLPLQYQSQFLDLLKAYAPVPVVVEPTVKPTVEPTVKAIVAKPSNVPSKATSKPSTKSTTKAQAKVSTKKPSEKQLIIKLYNASTQAHEELSLPANEVCDVKMHEVIALIREQGFDASHWSFKIRVPMGL